MDSFWYFRTFYSTVVDSTFSDPDIRIHDDLAVIKYMMNSQACKVRDGFYTAILT